jgi:hypothetical protein
MYSSVILHREELGAIPFHVFILHCEWSLCRTCIQNNTMRIVAPSKIRTQSKSSHSSFSRRLSLRAAATGKTCEICRKLFGGTARAFIRSSNWIHGAYMRSHQIISSTVNVRKPHSFDRLWTVVGSSWSRTHSKVKATHRRGSQACPCMERRLMYSSKNRGGFDHIFG